MITTELKTPSPSRSVSPSAHIPATLRGSTAQSAKGPSLSNGFCRGHARRMRLPKVQGLGKHNPTASVSGGLRNALFGTGQVLLLVPALHPIGARPSSNRTPLSSSPVLPTHLAVASRECALPIPAPAPFGAPAAEAVQSARLLPVRLSSR